MKTFVNINLNRNLKDLVRVSLSIRLPFTWSCTIYGLKSREKKKHGYNCATADNNVYNGGGLVHRGEIYRFRSVGWLDQK